MAKKRHWKRRAKAKESLQSTENEKARVEKDKKVPNVTEQSETTKCKKVDADRIVVTTRVVDGEKCLDIDCGPNKAVLYLSKMCLGSKGACILFKGSWLTPNEFQFVSGRETAKDWKRSIRHSGTSLKNLIAKKLLKIQPISKKAECSSDGRDNDEHIIEETPSESSDDLKTNDTDSIDTDNVRSPSTDSNATIEGADLAELGNSPEPPASEESVDEEGSDLPSKDMKAAEEDNVQTDDVPPDDVQTDDHEETADVKSNEDTVMESSSGDQAEDEQQLVETSVTASKPSSDKQQPASTITDNKQLMAESATDELLITTKAADDDQHAVDDDQLAAVENVPLTAADGDPLVAAESEQLTAAGDDQLETADNEQLTAANDEQLATADYEQLTTADDEQSKLADDEQLTKVDDLQLTSADDQQLTSADDQQLTKNDEAVDDQEMKTKTVNEETIIPGKHEDEMFGVIKKPKRPKRKTKRWASTKSRSRSKSRSRKSHIAEHDIPLKTCCDDVISRYDTLKEEEKLAVFVKALRLLRKRDLPAAAPEQTSSVTSIQQTHKENDPQLKPQCDVEDREMPVLEKEVDFVLPAQSVQPTQPNIIPSTVTPPPTPPLSGSPDLDEIKRELKNIDSHVFQSRLSPVEEGLKLKINRLVDNNEKVIKPESVDTKLSQPEHHSVLSTVVQDSGLHKELMPTTVNEQIQNSQHCGIHNLANIKRDTKQYSELSENFDHKHRASSCSQGNVRAGVPQGILSEGDAVSGAVLTGKEKQDNSQYGGVSVVTTPYGPMLVPTEENFRLYHEMLAAYSSMHQSYRRPDMSNASRKSCVSNNKTAYNMYSSMASMARQQQTHAAYQQGKSALFEGTNFQRRISEPGEIPHGAKCESYRTHCDGMDRKRKYAECEGALDLSMKKPKVEPSPSPVKHSSFNYVLDQDSPVDFSMKRQMSSEHRQTSSDHSKPTYSTKQHNFTSPSQQTYSAVNRPYSSVDHKRDKPYSVMDKPYSAMDKPYSTSTIGDVKRYSVANKPSYSVDNKLYTRDNRPYSVNNKQYSVENKPYSVQNTACRPNSSAPVSPQTYSSAQGNKTPQDSKTPQIKRTQKQSIYNSLWSGVTKHLDKDMSKWTVDNVVAFVGCLEGCTEYMQMFREQGISGRILPYLTTQHLTRTLGMRVGPALTLQYAIGRFFKDASNPNLLVSRQRLSV